MASDYGIDYEVTLGALAMIRASLVRDDAPVAMSVLRRYGALDDGNENLAKLIMDLVEFAERLLFETCAYDVAAAAQRVDDLIAETTRRQGWPA